MAFSSPPLQGTEVSLHQPKRCSGFCTWLPVVCYSSGAVHHLHAAHPWCVVIASTAIILPATHRKPHSISQASVLPSTHTPSHPPVPRSESLTTEAPLHTGSACAPLTTSDWSPFATRAEWSSPKAPFHPLGFGTHTHGLGSLEGVELVFGKQIFFRGQHL